MRQSFLNDMIDDKLLSNRTVFLWGQVDDKSARHVIKRLLFLELREPGKDIRLIINSPGGYVTSGFAVYDTIKGITSPVSTVCTGIAASMASILLSAGFPGKRFVMRHGRVMIHQPAGGTRGNSADIEIQAAEIQKTKTLGAKILSENCGQPYEKILKDFNRDYFMDADESVNYGIADGILDRF